MFMKGNPYYRAYQFFSSEMGLSGAEKDVFGVIYNAVANMKGVVSIRQIEMRTTQIAQRGILIQRSPGTDTR